MTRRASPNNDPRQTSLLGLLDAFPVRRPAERYRPVDLSLRIKTALGQALKECPDSAAVVAARMSEISGREVSTDMLYAYTAPSKPEHDIPVTRLIAFVRATGARWIYDLLVEDEGLTVIEGREAKLAQLGMAQQELAHLQARIREISAELKAEPVAGAAETVRRRPAIKGGRP